ncbi:MAG: hypothetical protein LBE79_05355 [Tannerella sp.]|nr:hypothetical protein [Tannerella sp.]
MISKIPSGQSDNRTVFGEEVIAEFESGRKVVQKEYRNKRKLVGWLITQLFQVKFRNAIFAQNWLRVVCIAK